LKATFVGRASFGFRGVSLSLYNCKNNYDILKIYTVIKHVITK
jgi:hypothetical protein